MFSNTLLMIFHQDLNYKFIDPKGNSLKVNTLEQYIQKIQCYHYKQSTQFYFRSNIAKTEEYARNFTQMLSQESKYPMLYNFRD